MSRNRPIDIACNHQTRSRPSRLKSDHDKYNARKLNGAPGKLGTNRIVQSCFSKAARPLRLNQSFMKHPLISIVQQAGLHSEEHKVSVYLSVTADLALRRTVELVVCSFVAARTALPTGLIETISRWAVTRRHTILHILAISYDDFQISLRSVRIM
jgi:hypothetical protein